MIQAYDDAAFHAQVAEADALFGAGGKLTELFEAQEKRLLSRGYVDGRTVLSKIAVPLTEHLNAASRRLESVMPVVMPQRDRGYISAVVAEKGFEDKVEMDDVASRVSELREKLSAQGHSKSELEGQMFIGYAVREVLLDMVREGLIQPAEEGEVTPPARPPAPRHVAPHAAPSRMSSVDRTPSNVPANRPEPVALTVRDAIRNAFGT